MATIEHKGYAMVGDIVVYDYGTTSPKYGHLLLKQVWVDAVDEYRWVTEPVKIRDNEVVKYLHGGLDLITHKTVKDEYPLKWTKDPEFKKGDILLGKDGDKTMIFVYFSETHVERLTPRSDMWNSSQQGYSTLSDFTKNFGPLTKAKPAHPSVQSF